MFQSNCCLPGCQSAVVRGVLVRSGAVKPPDKGASALALHFGSVVNPLIVQLCHSLAQFMECLGETKLQNTHLTPVGIQFLRPHKQES